MLFKVSVVLNLSTTTTIRVRARSEKEGQQNLQKSHAPKTCQKKCICAVLQLKYKQGSHACRNKSVQYTVKTAKVYRYCVPWNVTV